MDADLSANDPLPRVRADELVARMPPKAVADMTQWTAAYPVQLFESMLDSEYVADTLLIDRSRTATVAISDDRAVNEFYLRLLTDIGLARSPSGGPGVPTAAAPW